ncbi:MAG: hypothetical protein GY785_21455 [Gammaproteobacteria bacterium]|nr:hypothetical protein [Gammaproteobacteria bacterium]
MVSMLCLVVYRLLGQFALVAKLQRLADGLIQTLRRHQDHDDKQDRHGRHGETELIADEVGLDDNGSDCKDGEQRDRNCRKQNSDMLRFDVGQLAR